MSYTRAANLEHALDLLNETSARVVCGGTDWMAGPVKLPSDARIIDVSRVESLRRIETDGDMLSIGAAVTWSMVERADLPSATDGLRDAAREIGSMQIRNRASIGGNICNGSPAADGVTMLLALDANVVLSSVDGQRSMPLELFLLDKGRVELRAGEMLTKVHVPITKQDAIEESSGFFKLGIRRQLNIAVVSGALWVQRDSNGALTSMRIAAGSVARTPMRLRSLEEAATIRLRLGLSPHDAFDATHTSELRPIDDIRADASYRRSVMGEVLARAYASAIGERSHAQET